MDALHQLITGAQAGDLSSIEALVNRYGELIEMECGKYGLWQHPDWSHSDLFQEVCFQVWTKIDQFKGANQPEVGIVFEQWLRKTAQSVLSNLLRYQKAKKRMPEGGIQPFEEATQSLCSNRNRVRTASSIFASRDEAERIRAAMETYLDEHGRQILNLRIVDGLSLREIAKRLSLTYEQVRYKFQISVAELERRLD